MKLPMFLPKKAVILTCMDFRLNNFLSSVTPDTFRLRNAGGRVTKDSIRSLVVLYKILGIEEIYLIQHTDCGMQKFTDEVMNKLLEESIAKDISAGRTVHKSSQCKKMNECCEEDTQIDWRTIKEGVYISVVEDVKLIRNHPLIPSNVPIYGFVFDVATNELIPVPEATEVGRAQ